MTAVAIRSKSLSYNYTVVIPQLSIENGDDWHIATYLDIGICVVMKEDEPV
ncbi:MAG: hypothetical protein ACLUOI_33750 [Eisenbergiella sp.]